jgi:hypothetical protein
MEDTIIKDILKTAEALYHRGDYQGALRVLENHQVHLPKGLWHYNMGTLNAKLENLPLSRYHFIMADIEGFTNKDLIKNKLLVEKKLDVPRHEKSLSISDYLMRGSLEATYGIFTTISLFLILCGIFLSIRKSNLKAMKFPLIFSLFFLLFNFWVLSWEKYIVMENLNIHEGPSSIFLTNQELPSGVMIVVKEKEDWLEILYPSQYAGWIRNTGIRSLK